MRLVMQILFVSTYDLRRNTSSNIRTIALMQALAKAGHVIHVAYIPSCHESDIQMESCITSHCERVFHLIESPNTNQLKNDNNNTGIMKEKVKKLILNTYNKVCIYDVFQTKISKIKYDSLKSISQYYDIIISSSEPRSSHKLAGFLIKKGISCNKWIMYWGDPITNDVASKKWFPFREQLLEKSLLEQSDISIYTNPACCEYMKRKYSDYANKIYWIPTSDIQSVIPLRESNKYLISYVGDYRSDFRNIMPLYNVCIRQKQESIIAGGSDLALEGNKKLKILGRIPKLDADEIENDSRILVVLDNEKQGGKCIQVPGKMYHYALTNKYILVISNSDSLKQYYNRYERYIFVHNTVESIEKGISAILTGNLPDSYHKPVVQFEQKNIVDTFMDIVFRKK